MLDYVNYAGEFLGYAIVYPLIGILVVAAGWSVGEVLKAGMPRTVMRGVSYWGHLFVLGFITHTAAWAAYGQP